MAILESAAAVVGILAAINSIFSGGDDTKTIKTEQTTSADPRGYQSPFIGPYAEGMMGELMQQLMGFQGAGMPGGQGVPGGGDFFSSILELLQGSWPDLMAGFQTGTPPGENRLTGGLGATLGRRGPEGDLLESVRPRQLRRA